MGDLKIVSLDVGNTLIHLENDGFCTDFRVKTGFPREQLRPLFFEHFLTKNQPLEDAVYTVCELIGYSEGQKLIDEFTPAVATLYEDTLPALEEISKAGITMIATSNCTPWEAGGLEKLGLDRYLSRVFYSYAIGHAKPDIATFRHVEKALGAAPHQMIHVGDSWAADIEGALAAGWQTVFLCRDKNAATPSDPRVQTISSLKELPRIVCG